MVLLVLKRKWRKFWNLHTKMKMAQLAQLNRFFAYWRVFAYWKICIRPLFIYLLSSISDHHCNPVAVPGRRRRQNSAAVPCNRDHGLMGRNVGVNLNITAPVTSWLTKVLRKIDYYNMRIIKRDTLKLFFNHMNETMSVHSCTLVSFSSRHDLQSLNFGNKIPKVILGSLT